MHPVQTDDPLPGFAQVGSEMYTLVTGGRIVSMAIPVGGVLGLRCQPQVAPAIVQGVPTDVIDDEPERRVHDQSVEPQRFRSPTSVIGYRIPCRPLLVRIPVMLFEPVGVLVVDHQIHPVLESAAFHAPDGVSTT